ncbi:unnamed protein product [Paramecium sonneborni]|uniref:Uncharacterized protein n=1 Tax=Paramecium sonneborni TaxID=65129 RepID=A0A8S1LG15_9CILI|nr:unnamed protein product [Paramecium sonneborni]
MKPSKQQQQLQQPLAQTKQNYISKNQQNEKMPIQKEHKSGLVQYKPQNIQNTSFIRIIEYDQNENKENQYQKLLRRMDLQKQVDENQTQEKSQKLKKKQPLEVEQNLKQRSYSALPVLKRWSPTEKINQTHSNQFWKQYNQQDEFNSSIQNLDKKQLYFAYFWIDKDFNSFMPTFCALNQQNVDKCYNQLMHLLKYNVDD